MEFSDARNSDPFGTPFRLIHDMILLPLTVSASYTFTIIHNYQCQALSQRLRKTFRKEKAELITKSRGDDQLRSKYSLPAGLKFIEPEDGTSDQHQIMQARRLIDSHRAEVQAKRCRLSAELGLPPIRSQRELPPKAAQLANLKQKLAPGRQTKVDTFISRPLVSRRPMGPAKPLATSSALAAQPKDQPRSTTGSSKKPLASLAVYTSD